MYKSLIDDGYECDGSEVGVFTVLLSLLKTLKEIVIQEHYFYGLF